MSAVTAFMPTKYRKTRSPLAIEPLYDISQVTTYEAFHVTHGQVSQEEVDDMIARALANRRRGDAYIPFGEAPESLSFFYTH